MRQTNSIAWQYRTLLDLFRSVAYEPDEEERQTLVRLAASMAIHRRFTLNDAAQAFLRGWRPCDGFETFEAYALPDRTDDQEPPKGTGPAPPAARWAGFSCLGRRGPGTATP